jgi:anti-sigma factor RsiW
VNRVPSTRRRFRTREIDTTPTQHEHEGALPPASRRRFDEHLTSCPFCRIHLEQMRDTIRALGRLPEDGISPAALDALRGHFRRWR